MSEKTEKPPILDSSQSSKNSFRYLLWAALPIFVLAAVWSLWVGGLRTKAEISMYSASGGGDPFWDTFGSGFLLMIAGFFAFCFLVLGFILCLLRRSQSAGIMMHTCSLSFMGGCFGGMQSKELVFGNPSGEAFSKLEIRMAPLVEAIESYHRDTGTYPEELNLLVPKYLVQLPATQMGKYTNYNYYVGERAQSFHSNLWIIEIPVGYGMGFDQFYYFPLQNYPSGRPYEKIGKWAYFHE